MPITGRRFPPSFERLEARQLLSGTVDAIPSALETLLPHLTPETPHVLSTVVPCPSMASAEPVVGPLFSPQFSPDEDICLGLTERFAILGDGFFVVLSEQTGGISYTRDGSFRVDEYDRIVDRDGSLLLGYGVGDNHEIVRSNRIPLSVPYGREDSGQTTRVWLRGTLNPAVDGDRAFSQDLVVYDHLRNPIPLDFKLNYVEQVGSDYRYRWTITHTESQDVLVTSDLWYRAAWQDFVTPIGSIAVPSEATGAFAVEIDTFLLAMAGADDTTPGSLAVENANRVVD